MAAMIVVGRDGDVGVTGRSFSAGSVAGRSRSSLAG